MICRSANFTSAQLLQRQSALLSLRFLNGNVEMSKRDCEILAQIVLRHNDEEERKEAFEDALACGNRVRDLVAWGATPLTRLFQASLVHE